jgi:hypothetical protein
MEAALRRHGFGGVPRVSLSRDWGIEPRLKSTIVDCSYGGNAAVRAALLLLAKQK